MKQFRYLKNLRLSLTLADVLCLSKGLQDDTCTGASLEALLFGTCYDVSILQGKLSMGITGGK